VILLTVGTQLPFDRLVAAVDRIAPQLSAPVIAQIGAGRYIPQNMEWKAHLDPIEFDRMFRDASVVVSHAGIGTVLAAQKHRKPVVLFPRRADLREHRNDHQSATAAQLTGRRGVYVARTEEELLEILSSDKLEAAGDGPIGGRARLISHISDYVGTMHTSL
jgi:UDP-N-acetylglucosamine transferase subunit ALG13